MKAVGLITEYNPFHNGHKYHIDEAKRITGADIIIVVMSGNFVQRGVPAFLDKYERSKMALSCGADIVFELPVCYATGSAEYFALGAVSLLHKLGIVDYLCFGSECGNIEQLRTIAEIILEESDEYNKVLNILLKKGKTFPAARMEAVKKIAPNIDISLLDSPNNILGIEYLKALIHLNSSIRPITITRRAADYHDEELSQNKESVISSASAIRKSCRENDTIVLLNNHVPEPVYHILKEKYLKTYPIFEDDCSLIMNYKLLQESKQSLSEYIDVTDELANRINHINAAGMTFSQLALTIKTKQWTLTRINRALIHILLNLYNKNFTAYNNAGYTQYARLLGLNKTVSPVLRSIASKGTIPVITKMADAKLLISEPGINMLNEDILAANIYNEIVHHKYKCLLKDEYRQGIILYNK